MLYGFETCIGWETLALAWAPWLITVVVALVAAWKMLVVIAKISFVAIRVGLGF